MPRPPDLHVLADPATAVGDLLAEQTERGGSIALTGGSAPGPAYEHAAARVKDWSRAILWWGDERAVPPDDELSNYRLAKQTLLDRIDVQPREIHRIEGELGAEDAARKLDAELAGVELDVLLLGMGPDGHIASLFPGSPQLQVTDRRAVAGPPGLEPLVDRVTMTLPTLQAAKRIVFLITGADKAEIVKRAFEGDINYDVPAGLMRLAPVSVEVFLDEAAGGKIGSA
jgi:6-phosphogluconolactonase